MTAAEIAMLLQIALVIGPQAYDFLTKISNGNIPTWDELEAMNKNLQDRINKAKEN